jgi:chromosome segregation ATPase
VSLQRALALTLVLTKSEKDETVPASLVSYVEKKDDDKKLLRLTDSFLQSENSKEFLQRFLERVGSASLSNNLRSVVSKPVDLFVSSSALCNPSPRKRRRCENAKEEEEEFCIRSNLQKSQEDIIDEDDDDDLPIECLDLLMKQERVRIAAKDEDDRCEEKVQEVDAAIESNEKLLIAIKERLKKYETLKSNVANLTEAIREVTKERDELRQSKQKSSSTNKIARLTDQLKEMKRKQRANQKELRNAESCIRRAKSLENLIVRLKASKIQMMKRAKDRAREHRENMTSLGKQIRKLRNAHIKQQRKMSGLKHKHARTALKLERREKVYGRT